MQINKKNKNNQFKYDEIRTFDPKKEIMGLMKDGITTEIDDNANKSSKHKI